VSGNVLKRGWAVLLAVLAVAVCLGAQPVRAQPLVLKNFTLIDGSGAPPISGSAVVIDSGGHIEWVGATARLKAPEGAKLIDLGGKYVIPGLIDAHIHLGLVHGLKQDVDFYTTDLVQEQLKTYAAYGITSVLVLGTDKDSIFDIRAAQHAGRPELARVFTAGQGLVYKGSYGGVPKLNQPVATAQEARAAVDSQASKGVDLIKLWVDDEFGTLPVRMPADISQAIIDQAHKHHLKVVAHVFYLDNAKTLVSQGVDALAHSVRDKPVDQDLLRAMKQHGTWQLAETLSREASFTYTRLPFLDDPFFNRSIPPPVLQELASPQRVSQLEAAPNFARYKPAFETAMSNTGREVQAGVPYGMGTDSGPSGRFAGYFAHWELQLMVRAGLTPLQVLTAATGGNANFIGATDLGTIAPHKWADLVVLDRDPVADIRNTRTLHAVYVAGREVPTIWQLCVGRPTNDCKGGPDGP
jgi:imidazolonepropionase-like amidohydrolase